MSLKYPLNETLSPIDREGRNRLNDNWTRIMAYFDHVQLQIKALAGGQEVDELIARLEQAIANAEADLQNYIAQVDTTVQEAINANNTATQDAIAKNDTALQISLGKVANKLLEVNQAIENADTSAEGANAAKQGALDATAQAQTAITDMQSLINNTVHRGIWNNTTQYFKNNMATYNGSAFIALQDNVDKSPPTLPTQSNPYWTLFAEKGATGATGPEGRPGKDGKDGKDGTGVNIIGSLASEADLPQTGSPGDAYMIGGDLYVWQENLNNWKNAGPIQGPEGKSAYDLAVQNGFVGTMEEWLESLKGGIGPPGPDGPQGPPGQDADLTEVNQEIANIKQTVTDNKTEVTEHLGHLVTDINGVHGLKIEKGIWTPEFGGSDKLGTVTYTSRTGEYYKIGNLVYILADIKFTSLVGGSGYYTIKGLPFLPTISSEKHFLNISQNISTLADVIGDLYSGRIYIRKDKGSGAIDYADIGSSSRFITLSGIFRI